MREGKIRFNTVFVSNNIPSDPKIFKLKNWSEIFQKNGLTPEVKGNYTGNLSFRSRDGFVITASGLKDKENLGGDCFVYIKDYDEVSNTFSVEGQKKPSSETLMHHLLYEGNQEINAVFHGHNNIIVAVAKELKLVITEKEFESGTIELAKEVQKVSENNKLIVLRNHGFVTVGNDMKEAGELALTTLQKAKCKLARQFSNFSC
jgi:ribulose-5-phosphate 4-epimerase/fuculose-1-phosphate aldolase